MMLCRGFGASGIHVLLDRFVKQLGVSRVAPTSFIDMEEKAYPFSFPM
jgi:hypothetical protein